MMLEANQHSGSDGKPPFQWRDHLPLLISATIPILAVCQVAAISGYNLPLTMVVLSSSGSTVGILLRSFFAALPIFGVFLTLSLLAYALALKLTRSKVYDRYKLGPTLMKLAPFITGIIVISLALSPWPAVVICTTGPVLMLLCNVLISIAVDTLAALTKRIAGKDSHVVQFLEKLSPRIFRASTRDTIIRSSFVAWLLLFWLVGYNWAPYESIEPAGSHSFTGSVVGIEGSRLVILTAGDPTIVRLPVDSTERSLCIPHNINRRNPKSIGKDLWNVQYQRTIPQLVLNIPNKSFIKCPSENHPK